MCLAGEAGGRQLRFQGARHQQWRRRTAQRAALESRRVPAQRRRNDARNRRLRGMTMKHATLLALAATATLGLVLGLVAARAVPVVYKTPLETAEFKPGPNLELVKNNCSGC